MFNKTLDTGGKPILSGEAAVCVCVCVSFVCLCVYVSAPVMNLLCAYPSVLHYSVVNV